jgi:hypothetical protein
MDPTWQKWFLLTGAQSQTTGKLLYGTNAQRLGLQPTALQDGTQIVVTDLGNVTYQWQNSAWAYLSGTYSLNQADIAAFKATLGVGDTGLRIYVQDFDHALQWNGQNFQWAPLPDKPAYIKGFEADPNPINGWALCDGSATTYLNPDGTTTPFTTPNLIASPVAMKLGPVASLNQVNPAKPPTFTGDAAQGIVDAPVLAMDPYQPAGLIGPPPFSQTVGVQGGSLSAATGTHSHPFTGQIAVLTGKNSAPAFNGQPVTGKLSSDTDLPNVTQRPWFRR